MTCAFARAETRPMTCLQPVAHAVTSAVIGLHPVRCTTLPVSVRPRRKASFGSTTRWLFSPDTDFLTAHGIQSSTTHAWTMMSPVPVRRRRLACAAPQPLWQFTCMHPSAAPRPHRITCRMSPTRDRPQRVAYAHTVAG
ncbi:hypothetical protein B0H13DRAFT_2682707 [Mycena leptocephala]|nr:hypothetical protein B0H13DRAFT_2682707 [Mycena leptocephala]